MGRALRDISRQGLLYHNGTLIESTGEYGRSVVRRYKPGSTKALQQVRLASRYFGEGCTINGDELVVLTWRERTGFRLDLGTLKQTGKFQFSTSRGEGWGITALHDKLWVTDGSAYLHAWDPRTLAETSRVLVTDPDTGKPVSQLNELEAVGTELFANIWFHHKLARIDPSTGNVLGWIDMHEIVARHARLAAQNGNAVLNGIAVVPGSVPTHQPGCPPPSLAGTQLYITGKMWPALYLVELVER